MLNFFTLNFQSTGDSSISSGSAGERSVSPTRSDESAELKPTPRGLTHSSSSQPVTQVPHNHVLSSSAASSKRPVTTHESVSIASRSSSTSDHSSSVTVRSSHNNSFADPAGVRSSNNNTAVDSTDDGRPPGLVPPARTKKRKAPPAPPVAKTRQVNGKVRLLHGVHFVYVLA